MSDIGQGISQGINILILGIVIWGSIFIGIIALLYWWLGPIGWCI